MSDGFLVLYGSIGGFAAGLLGIGGGIILIPLLVYLAGISLRSPTSISLVFILFSASSGLGAHFKAGNTDLRLGLWMGTGAVAGALGGAHLAGMVSDRFLLALLGAVTALSASVLLVPRPEDLLDPPSGTLGKCGRNEARVKPAFALAVGLGQGLLAGLLGLGGGVIVIPLLVYLLGVNTHKALGTSLAVVWISAAAGLAWKASTVETDTLPLLLVIAGAVPAAWLGGRVAARLSPRLLRLLLSLILWSVTARTVLALTLRV